MKISIRKTGINRQDESCPDAALIVRRITVESFKNTSVHLYPEQPAGYSPKVAECPEVTPQITKPLSLCAANLLFQILFFLEQMKMPCHLMWTPNGAVSAHEIILIIAWGPPASTLQEETAKRLMPVDLWLNHIKILPFIFIRRQPAGYSSKLVECPEVTPQITKPLSLCAANLLFRILFFWNR